MVDRIAFNKAAENLIEITKVFVEENAKYDLLENIESRTWNEKFVDWSNKFEEQHKTTDWNSGEYGEYYDEIRKYAKEKIAEYFKEEQTWRRK